MPFNSEAKAWSGPDARAPRETARNTFIAVLTAILNDPDAALTYAAQMNLTEGEAFNVTSSRTQAGELWEAHKALIYVQNGDEKSWGTARKRHQITLNLDVGILAQPGLGNEEQQRLDSLAADLVTDAVRSHLSAYNAAGLFQISVTGYPENQRAAQGRNPLRVVLWLTTQA